MNASDDVGMDAVKRARRPAGGWHSMVTISMLFILLNFVAITVPALGDDRLGSSRVDRPPPSVTRQVDRLNRSGAADPLTKRRLQDQLRREAPSAARSSAERTLDRLPSQTLADPKPLPASPEPGSLPSSLPSSIEGAGSSGFVPPPGTRGQQR
mgnify:CR=1 FL=1